MHKVVRHSPLCLLSHKFLFYFLFSEELARRNKKRARSSAPDLPSSVPHHHCFQHVRALCAVGRSVVLGQQGHALGFQLRELV